MYISTLQPKMKNDKLLPVLIPAIDANSFASIFGSTRTTGSGQTNYYGGQTTYQNWSSTTYTNPRINEINTIFERDVLGNISASYGTTKGRIVCKAVIGYNSENLGWLVPNILLACVPAIFGAPMSSWKTQLQIEVMIYDVNNNVVGRYTSGLYQQKTYVAAYWGYHRGNSEPRSVRLVFTKCMEDIKRQIQRDYNRLNTALQ